MVLYVLAIGTLYCLIRKAGKKFSTAFLHTDFAFLIRKAVKKIFAAFCPASLKNSKLPACYKFSSPKHQLPANY